jgi:hypothetical protein
VENHSLRIRKKTKNFVDNLEAQFQQVTNPSVPPLNEMVDIALRSYSMTPASQPNLTNPDEVQETIRVSRSARLSAQTESATGP